MNRPASFPLALAAVVLVTTAPAWRAGDRDAGSRSPAGTPFASLHLELEKSAPAAGEALSESPGEIVLEFSQAPQMAGTSVRVVGPDGEPAQLPDARADDGDPTIVRLAIPAPLEGGKHEVRWRAMARDGHVVWDTFLFTIEAGAGQDSR